MKVIGRKRGLNCGSNKVRFTAAAPNTVGRWRGDVRPEAVLADQYITAADSI